MRTVAPVVDFTSADLQAVFADAEANQLRKPTDFREQVLDRIAHPGRLSGLKLPWPKTHDLIRLRMGEVSIWAGINGHKKSTLLNQVALWAAHEVQVGIASFEMPVDGLVHLMCQQGSGTPSPAHEWADTFMTWLDESMWFYDRLGSVPPIEVLGAIHALAQRGCKLVVIDSLSMCRVSDDMERERLFMSELTSLAKALDIHVCLVHHVRKPQSGGDEHVPSRFDVKGNGAIVDLTQNLFLIWADKKRSKLERLKEMGAPLDPKDHDYLQENCDQKFIVAKQRHGEFEGGIKLWAHPSRQFCESRQLRAQPIY